MTQLFSIVAMFIMFRVWFGVALGVTLSVLLGVVFIIVFYVTKNSVFSGAGKSIFKGYVNLLASFLIALLGFAMLRFMNYEKKWELKLARMKEQSDRKQKADGKGTNWAIFLLCFSAVFREGIEAVIFLAGVSTTESVTAIPIAAVVGIICGLAVGFILFYTGREIKDLWWFFILSFVLLFLIGAGLVSTGVSAWQSIGWWGTFFPTVNRPWWNQAVWDTCGCCSDNITSNKFFGLMNAIFGYQCQPTFISIFSYCMFWFIVFVAVIAKWWRGSLTDAFYKIKKQENKRRAKLGLAKMTKAEEEQFVKEQLDNRYQVNAGEEDRKDSSEEERTSDDRSPTSSSSGSKGFEKKLKKLTPDPQDPFNIKPDNNFSASAEHVSEVELVNPVLSQDEARTLEQNRMKAYKAV